MLPISDMTWKSKLGTLARSNVSFYDLNVQIFGFESFNFSDFVTRAHRTVGLEPVGRGLMLISLFGACWCCV